MPQRFNKCRGVAQPGRALGSGPRGRRFESSRPDKKARGGDSLSAALLDWWWLRNSPMVSPQYDHLTLPRPAETLFL